MKRTWIILLTGVVALLGCAPAGTPEAATRAPILPTAGVSSAVSPTAKLPLVGSNITSSATRPESTDASTQAPIQTPTTVKPDNTAVAPTPTQATTQPPLPGGNILFKEDFSDPSSGWDTYLNDNGSADYKNGKYEITVVVENYLLWGNAGQSFDDAAVAVDAAPTAGPQSNEMGLICRYVDTKNFMYASIGSDGYYGIYEIKAGTQTRLSGGGELAVSSAIKQGSATNHLQFVCKGVEYTLIVNGQAVDTVTNSALSSGDVGLAAGTFDRSGVTINFDNFVVTAP